jgi:hypothetical protein
MLGLVGFECVGVQRRVVCLPEISLRFIRNYMSALRRSASVSKRRAVCHPEVHHCYISDSYVGVWTIGVAMFGFGMPVPCMSYVIPRLIFVFSDPCVGLRTIQVATLGVDSQYRVAWRPVQVATFGPYFYSRTSQTLSETLRQN